MTPSNPAFALIPLNKLVPWEGNVRKTNTEENIEELVASIAAEGVLQSLLVRKAKRGTFSVIAGRRRWRALSILAERGSVPKDAPVPCTFAAANADPTEISLDENVVRVPMHPADQFEAFRDLIDKGHTPAEIAARFGIAETAVKQRMKLARVSPKVFDAYREGGLTLEQVQAFTVSDDHAAQERVFGDLSEWNDDADTIRDALTEGDIAGTDRRVRFVTVAAYEGAGGAARRDLFTEGDSGVFLLDSELLDHLAREKLEELAETVKAEGWKWVEAAIEFDSEARSRFKQLRPESLPMSEEVQAEHRRLAEEYQTLVETGDEEDEARSERLDAIEARIEELENTGKAFTPDAFATGGAMVTIGNDGELEVVRGLVRRDDAPEEAREPTEPKEKVPFSAALVESLTAQRSAAISASLLGQPDIALASVTHALAAGIFTHDSRASSLQITLRQPYIREACRGVEALNEAHAKWSETLPGEAQALWDWCLTQDRDTLLDLLAYCAALSLDGVRRKSDDPESDRLRHADALASAMSLNMHDWFTPTAENYFSRVGRPQVLNDLAQAKGAPAKRSWEKHKKAALAALAEREVVGTGWLPLPLQPARMAAA